ncbi:MAG: hypothetical protein EB156_05910, partial [Euryarchaeota archaeon]|nr:hypothetical protein [Euryarchaeota archaeon]NDG22165.1 hypothetical protein [Euryarchaeota archaeon]
TVSNRVIEAKPITTEDAFQINAAKVVWNDYDPTLDAVITNRAVGVNNDGVFSIGSQSLKFNLENLTKFSMSRTGEDWNNVFSSILGG